MSGLGSQPLQMEPQPPKRPHGPRLYHKKSKTGCYRCKGRRVKAFHEYLRARRPRALVVLAYFFALWIPFRDVWMIGTAGLDQVRAIREALPPRWRGRLDPVVASDPISKMASEYQQLGAHGPKSG
ncbi:hypothetical protein MAPG_09122 [Magnaporthiopsis poae ATCC 64411]|uniref:Uncharacterized protein n=1 Tax=Magnaporthiopsis poae (strain ATCC 64411 / 73-15) TaxID=644358 RepID=A0A0C4E945_MAGP6|nr:hypothetical protein MAPG_09122 [Magnaporthiopsis poae ATCC 64411]